MNKETGPCHPLLSFLHWLLIPSRIIIIIIIRTMGLGVQVLRCANSDVNRHAAHLFLVTPTHARSRLRKRCSMVNVGFSEKPPQEQKTFQHEREKRGKSITIVSFLCSGKESSLAARGRPWRWTSSRTWTWRTSRWPTALILVPRAASSGLLMVRSEPSLPSTVPVGSPLRILPLLPLNVIGN